VDKNVRILDALFPRLVALELTRKCNLNCIQCRALAEFKDYEEELTFEEVTRILSEIRSLGQSIIILTGGEPLLRSDIFDIASYGSKIGLRMVLATNGMLNTPEIIQKMKASGIMRISISIDGASSKTHNLIRGEEGAFEGAVRGIKIAIENGMSVQVNTTITKQNVDEIDGILKLASSLKVASLHLFLLVPTGRAKELKDQEISPQKYEEVLHWFSKQQSNYDMELRTTCAPHYYRVIKQMKVQHPDNDTNLQEHKVHPLSSSTRGCLAGIGFAFISHRGIVQTCGYLDLECGNLRNSSFVDVWNHSPIFNKLRVLENYKGKCGSCEFIRACGGCRARAYAISGNYLDEEPYCIYKPRMLVKDKESA
jgi:AdoMet-dependent heme synthase